MAATVFAASSSGVLIDNEAVDGVVGIDYKFERDQGEVFALGSNERIAVYYGASRVQGRVRVASSSAKLDDLAKTGASFQVVANLKLGQAARSVAFDECFVTGKEFAMDAGAHGESIYKFSATRVREENPPAAPSGG